MIGYDSLSKLQLTSLDLSCNRIKTIEKNAFSSLKNLQTLEMCNNKLREFDPKFIGLRESEYIEYSIENNNFII